jgi:hypothetical protein
MKTLIEDIGDYLVSKGQTAPYYDYRPEVPDNLTTLIDTGGYDPDEVLVDLKRTVQVAVRNADKQTAKSNIWDVYGIIERPGNRFFVSNGRKMNIKAMQPPTWIYDDEKGRAIYAFNIEVNTVGD